MPELTTLPFAKRFRRPEDMSNPEESLGILRGLRPQTPAAPEMPAPGTDLGGGVRHIGMLEPGEDPFYGDSAVSQVKRQKYFGDANIDQAINQLTRMAGAKRGLAQQAQADDDYDLEFRAPGRAGLQANVEDITSERGAQRAFLPGAKAVYGRDRQAAESDIYNRFQLPAQLQNEATLGAAELRRQGQVEAANIRGQQRGNQQEELILKGLIDAMQRQMPQGQGLDPESLDGMVKYLAKIQLLGNPGR